PDKGQIVALLLMVVVAMVFVGNVNVGNGAKAYLWPVVLVGAGVALVWRQADNARRARWMEVGRRRRTLTLLRSAGGVLLVTAGVSGVFVLQGSAAHLGSVLQAALAVLVGITLLAGPYLVRMTQDLSEERLMRIRAQERAEVAAHVHDSVLHTLTLIQRNAENANEVRRLARAQERDLRTWLYKPEGTGKDEADEPTDLADAVRRNAAEVEDKHGVPIEVVVVGNCPLDERTGAQMQAAREAMVNAAKYGGEGGAVQVYAEVEGRTVFVSVRDRGPGFDLDSIPADRMGVRESIIGRMERHGGTARLRAVPGGGTEVELEMERAEMVLVDDHRMFRTGVQAEIGRTEETGVEVVGEAADVDQAVTVITATRPEVVLLDVHLPGGGGVEVLRRCAPLMADAEQPVRFLALSVSDAAEDVIGVIRGGARGYVTKTITGTDLVDSVFRVQEGDAVFSPRLAGFVLDAFASTDAPPVDEDMDRLTQREREVLRLIARGYAYKEIAKQLFISVKTVESHVSAVLRKLQLSNRHELTRWATARRLV
ncbi:MAG: response regulator, partial [Streptomyces sp.]|nr:response regulator [Streptomyces sp.]